MSIDEIMKLMEAMSVNGLTEFRYKTEEEHLIFKKNTVAAPVVISQTGVTAADSPEEYHKAVFQTLPEEPQKQEGGPVTDIGSDKVVVSPLVGTFYSSSSPENEAYVKVGDAVKKGQVLGIVEAMKLMNEIESEFDGVIEAVLVQNEDIVEYGQPLFRIG